MSDFPASPPAPPLFPHAPPPPGLPAPLVGRHTERHHALVALQGGAPLVTLAGFGGVGKTSLAQDLAAGWPGEACWVECALLTHAERLPDHLLTALGLPLALDTPPLDVLRAHARQPGPPVLIVLDNLEQLRDAPLAVRELLDLAPRLRFLVTSRVPLRLRDEHLVPLAPLVPPDASGDLDELHFNDAVTLFVRAARTVRPDFDLTPVGASGVARLCRRLDGLPLALELAARHMDVLSPDGLLGLLERHGTLPLEGELDRPERHRSLEALLESAHALLSAPERRVFCVLAVFGSPFDAADVRAILTTPESEGEVLGTLLKFARQGLVRSSPHGERPAFRLLETVRADAWSRLARAGERDAALEAHARRFARVASDTLHAARYHERYRFARERHDDVLRALEWFLARPDDDEDASRAALPVAGLLEVFWLEEGRLREGEEILRRVLARPGRFPTERPLAVLALALLLGQMGRHGEAVRVVEPVEADLYALPDPQARSAGLNNFAVVLASAEEHERAIRVWKDLIDFRVRAGFPAEQIDEVRHNVAAALSVGGEHEESRALLLDLVDRFRGRGALPNLAHGLMALSITCVHLGRLDEAERVADEARALAEREGLHSLRIYAAVQRCAVRVRRAPDDATVQEWRDVILDLERLGYGVETIEATLDLCLALLFLGRPHEGLAALDGTTASGTLPKPAMQAHVSLLHGLCALSLGRPDEASGHLEAALTEHLRRTRPLEYAAGVLARATVCDTFGDAAGAARLRAEYAALLAERRLTPWPALSAWSVLRATRPGPVDGASGREKEPRRATAPSVTPSAIPSVVLSARERDVLGRLARGDTNKQIGRALGVSENTVRAHLRSVSQKLGEHTRTGIVAHAARLGLVLAPDGPEKR